MSAGWNIFLVKLTSISSFLNTLFPSCRWAQRMSTNITFIRLGTFLLNMHPPRYTVQSDFIETFVLFQKPQRKLCCHLLQDSNLRILCLITSFSHSSSIIKVHIQGLALLKLCITGNGSSKATGEVVMDVLNDLVEKVASECEVFSANQDVDLNGSVTLDNSVSSHMQDGQLV